MKKLLAVLLAAVLALSGCGEQAEISAASRLAEVTDLTAAVCADLQPGESVDIAITPELKKCFWEGSRLEDWFHLPVFDEGNAPTHPLEYWIMLLEEGAVDINRIGGRVLESPWAKNPDNEYGFDGLPLITVAQFDEFVQTHFGDVTVEHEFYDGKYYYCDGEKYYSRTVEGTLPDYFGLTALAAEQREDGRLVYTAQLDDYGFNALNFFEAGEDRDPAVYDEWFANRMANDEMPPEDLAVLEVYGDQIRSGELTMDEAITKMVIDGQTDGFIVGGGLTVTFYIDEQTQEPVYLAVSDWQTDD